jgi:hypothetical protein
MITHKINGSINWYKSATPTSKPKLTTPLQHYITSAVEIETYVKH